MDQPRLFAIAPDAIALTARWEHPSGWSLSVCVSTAASDGRRTTTERYERLSSNELADVISCVVHEALKGVQG